MMDIGVLGGTFDPIHNGHLTIADYAIVKLGLERVLFVPAGQPWLKGHRFIASGAQRLEMVRLAIGSNRHFVISTVDLDREGPSYTEDTLRELMLELGESVNLYFIVGIDAMAELPTWRHPDRIIKMCHLVVMKRPISAAIDMESLERSVPGITERSIFLDNPPVDISSTAIRKRVASGSAITDLVPEAVEWYIGEQALYVAA